MCKGDKGISVLDVYEDESAEKQVRMFAEVQEQSVKARESAQEDEVCPPFEDELALLYPVSEVRKAYVEGIKKTTRKYPDR